MKIKVCVGNQILASGVEKLIVENLPDAVVSDAFRDAEMTEPDLVLFDSREAIDDLAHRYPTARLICLDLGLKEPELACLLLCHHVNGIISPDLDVKMFCKALTAVARGEIWVEQTHLKAMLRQGRGLPHREDFRGLSAQDKHIIRLLAQGQRNKEIADQLCLSVPTIKAHLSRIYKTLNVDNRSQLVALATESGWQKTP